MSTFQSIIYAILHGFTEFLPVSRDAHETLIPTFFQHFFDWNIPSPALLAALYLGSALSLLIYFRHDWASMTSSVLQIIVFRKKPMTLDERMPLFILLSTVPYVAVSYYFKDSLETFDAQPYWVVGSLVFFTVPFWVADSMNRKSRKIFDWNWLDALVLGFCQLTALVPGAGRQVGALTGAFARNYSLEATAKYLFYSQLPLLIMAVMKYWGAVEFGASQPSPDLSWLSFITATVVTCISGLLAIGGFMKSIHREHLRNYMLYRLVLAGGAGLLIWLGIH